ncbi:VOC family protein [Bacillus safensis]
MTTLRLDHTGIMVSNIDQSIDFYEKVVGMKLKDRITHTNGVIELAFLGFKDETETEIELIQGYSSDLPSEGKVHHLAFTTNNIHAEFNRIQKLQIELIDEEITTLPNGYCYFFFRGPDQEWIEFFQR